MIVVLGTKEGSLPPGSWRKLREECERLSQPQFRGHDGHGKHQHLKYRGREEDHIPAHVRDRRLAREERPRTCRRDFLDTRRGVWYEFSLLRTIRHHLFLRTTPFTGCSLQKPAYLCTTL